MNGRGMERENLPTWQKLNWYLAIFKYEHDSIQIENTPLDVQFKLFKNWKRKELFCWENAMALTMAASVRVVAFHIQFFSIYRKLNQKLFHYDEQEME